MSVLSISENYDELFDYIPFLFFIIIKLIYKCTKQNFESRKNKRQLRARWKAYGGFLERNRFDKNPYNG